MDGIGVGARICAVTPVSVICEVDDEELDDVVVVAMAREAVRLGALL